MRVFNDYPLTLNLIYGTIFRMRLRYAPLLISLLFSTLASVAETPIATENDFLAIQKLSKRDADKRCPVKFIGVVAHVFPWAGTFTLATLDAPCGRALYVKCDASNNLKTQRIGWETLRTGMVIELDGFTVAYRYAPAIHATAISSLRMMEMPNPPNRRLADLNTGLYDNQLVEIDGVIRRHRQSKSKFPTAEYEVVTPDGEFLAFIWNISRTDWHELVDAEVSFRGCATSLYNHRAEFRGVRVIVSRPEDFIITKAPPPNPFDIPKTPLDQLMSYSPLPPNLHRHKVQGVVTLAYPGNLIYIQDNNRSLCVHTADTNVLHMTCGDLVDCVGIPTTSSDFVELDDALARKVGHAQPPIPRDITLDTLFATMSFPRYNTKTTDFEGMLVSLKATIVEVEESNDTQQRIFFKAHNRTTFAVLDKPLSEKLHRALKYNPVVQLTGICSLSMERGLPIQTQPEPKDVKLLLRDETDIVIIPGTHWLTPERVHNLQISGGILLVCFAITISALLMKIMRYRRQRVTLQMVLEERKRIAADIHDTLEQSIAGVVMQLKAAAQTLPPQSETASGFIQLASQMITNAKADLRNSIWNLRSLSMKHQSLQERVLEMTKTIPSLAFTIDLTLLNALSETQKIHLFSIIQESLANTIKHSQATEVKITATSSSLQIHDNGCGFDQSTIPYGRFGLAGMNERCLKINATLTIQSTPSQGTTLTVQLNS
jgi:signal transduction histidine kinase